MSKFCTLKQKYITLSLKMLRIMHKTTFHHQTYAYSILIIFTITSLNITIPLFQIQFSQLYLVFVEMCNREEEFHRNLLISIKLKHSFLLIFHCNPLGHKHQHNFDTEQLTYMYFVQTHVFCLCTYCTCIWFVCTLIYWNILEQSRAIITENNIFYFSLWIRVCTSVFYITRIQGIQGMRTLTEPGEYTPSGMRYWKVPLKMVYQMRSSLVRLPVTALQS